MSAAGVRSFRPDDRVAVREICYQTGFMGDSVEGFWRHRESWAEIWTSYYRTGFLEHGSPTLVPGMRGKGGERLHQQLMVWTP